MLIVIAILQEAARERRSLYGAVLGPDNIRTPRHFINLPSLLVIDQSVLLEDVV